MKRPVEKCVRDVLEVFSANGWGDADEEQAEKMARFAAELLKWNRTFNLTAITDPVEVAELHFLDSLAIVPLLPEGAGVLDVGTGGGFPGVPAAIVRPDIEVLLVDRTEKKVAFLKNLVARLEIPNASARHLRLEGLPKEEGIGPFDVVVSRAFTAPEKWFPFAKAYLRQGGRILSMVGAETYEIEALAEASGLDPSGFSERRYLLPHGQKRGLIAWQG